MDEKSSSKKWLGYALLAIMLLAYLYLGLYRIAKGEAQWDVQTAFLTMLLLIIIGEVISTATKAFVPSMFISAILFVLGFWTILPKDILQQGGIASNLPTFLVMMMVVHLGTMLDIKELIDQWKTVVVTLAGMLGIMVIILTVGILILGRDTAAIAAPPLTGGFVAAMMMQSVAPTEHLAILAMAVYILQGFVGYPLTSFCLKKEGYSVLKKYRAGEWQVQAEKKNVSTNEKKNFIFPQLPDKYRSDFTYLFTMVLLTVVSGYLDKLSAGYVSKFVWALFLGVFATALGFTEKSVLVKARSMGFVYTIIMMFVFSQLSNCTPETVVQLIKDFAILIVLSTIGIAVFSIPIGKWLGMSTPMAFAIGLGSIAGGFPASYTLSVEAARVCSENPEEYAILESHMLPKTLVAGFVSATSGSVLIAGAVMTLFFK